MPPRTTSPQPSGPWPERRAHASRSPPNAAGHIPGPRARSQKRWAHRDDRSRRPRQQRASGAPPRAATVCPHHECVHGAVAPPSETPVPQPPPQATAPQAKTRAPSQHRHTPIGPRPTSPEACVSRTTPGRDRRRFAAPRPWRASLPAWPHPTCGCAPNPRRPRVAPPPHVRGLRVGSGYARRSAQPRVPRAAARSGRLAGPRAPPAMASLRSHSA